MNLRQISWASAEACREFLARLGPDADSVATSIRERRAMLEPKPPLDLSETNTFGKLGTRRALTCPLARLLHGSGWPGASVGQHLVFPFHGNHERIEVPDAIKQFIKFSDGGFYPDLEV